jgi:hypothetical protein
MRSSRHQRRREPPRKHPAGSRKKPPPERRRRRREIVSIEEAGEEFWEWAERIEEMAAQSEEQHYWEVQRRKLRRQRDASNVKRKWL